MKILSASNNLNKINEIKDILKTTDIELINNDTYPPLDVIEDAPTFIGNAAKKALAYARTYNQVSLADDSGLVVAAIDPLPGIYSKRYSGLGDLENNLKLLDVLQNETNRNAYFVCVIVIAFPDGKIFIYEGKLHGSIGYALEGSSGFGYDPLFIPEHKNASLAKLSSTYKQKHSHRYKALVQFVEGIDEVINYWRHSWQK